MIAFESESALFRRFARELVGDVGAATADLSIYSGADREQARIAWANRIYDEYRSVAVFSELLQLLADVEASFAALCCVHRLIGDELRHTETTAQVVEWLGGRADLAIDLSEVALPLRDESEPAIVRALHIIGRELVVAEEESVYALVAYRDATTEPAIRRVLAGILADEVRHAAAGRALYAELVERLDSEQRAELERVMAADRVALRDEYRASACGGPGRALGGSIERGDLDAIWQAAA